jgi:hypothetical protein
MMPFGGLALAQPPLPPTGDDVLMLDMDRATEPGCAIPVHSSSICLAERAAKADRWLEAVTKSCIAMAQERDATWGSGQSTAGSRRRSHEAFKQYREAETQAMADWVSPGNAVGVFMWGAYFELTVQRAAMLLGNFGRGDPSRVIDLRTTDWCDK